jgi:VanZ family protein
MAGIYGLSSLPGDVDESGLSRIIAWTPPAVQNLLHIPLFGMLAWLWYRTFSALATGHRFALLGALVLATGYGIFDEWHQLQVVGRYASFTDMLLNGAGALSAAWFINRSAPATG